MTTLAIRPLYLTLLFSLMEATLAWGGVRLPLHTLRDQAATSHCWAYAASHFLEARRLSLSDTEFMVDVETDNNYWVNFERMLSIFRTKNPDIYLGSSQGGWQIEYWNALLKHGRHIHHTVHKTPQVLYPLFENYNDHLPFMPPVAFTSDPTLPSFESLRSQFETQLKTESEAIRFAHDYLERYYGKPQSETKWFDNKMATNTVAPLLMGEDWKDHHDTEGLILIKPVVDGEYKWVKYLGERFWGYRYDRSKVLSLIKASLDREYPITFDNIGHAMTILGYETKGEITFYAVADSVPGKITWYDSDRMLSNLNLITFFGASIKHLLPEKPGTYRATKRYDLIDHLAIPPH